MSFSLTYDLEGAGWAMAEIRDGDRHVDITISYLHDSLRELAEAARALRNGAKAARVVFMDEPGEIQLLLNRDGGSLGYELRWFDDWNSWGMHPDTEYKIVHTGMTTVPRFVGEVRKEMEALLEQHGETGYREKWDRAEFPKALLQELQRKPMQSGASGS